MALPEVDNMVQLEIDATISGERYTNVCFYRQATAPTLDSLALLAEQWAARYVARMMPLHTNNVVITGATATELESGSRGSQQYVLPASVAGGDGNAYMPNNVAFCLKKLTNTFPLVKRGRLYIGGISRNATVAINEVSTAAADGFVDAWQTILLDMNDFEEVEGSMVVLHGYKNNADPADVTWSIWYDVTYTDKILDSQRRRLPGRGQ